MNNYTLYRQDFDSNNDYVSSVYVFINSHTLSQCEYLSTFNNMYSYVEKGGISSVYGYMNSHTDSQQSGLKSLMNYNDSNDTDMNYNLHNGDVISGIGLINSHTIPKYNELSDLNEINMGV